MNEEFFLLRSSLEHAILQAQAEKTLRKLNYTFITNRTERLTEFEVSQPAYFRIVAEKRSDPHVRNVMMIIPPTISESKGSIIDIRFDLDHYSTSARTQARLAARSFLRQLVSDLPQRPWEGLGFRQSRTEKAKWEHATSD